ncbi:polycystin family receptor for egg jelly-like [Ciona intestinalis]
MFVFLEVAVILPLQIVAVGENVTIYSEILNFRQFSEFFIVPVSCSISFGRSSPVSIETQQNASFYHQFSFPKTHAVSFSCEIPDGETIRAYGAVNVESYLNMDNLKITSRSQPVRFLTDTTLLFQYIYHYPIQHCFVLKTSQSCDRTKTFSQIKYENKGLIEVQFQLTTDIQSSIGPGIHPVTLFMQNNISDVKYISTVWINQQVKGVKVTCDPFVGIHPNYFTINITLREGCPANITIEIKKYPNNELVSQIKTLCSNPDECKLVQVKTSLNKAEEKYRVTVFANNQISNDSAVSQVFETVPQIYDVYMTSDGPLYANVPTNLMIYVRGDIGGFEMTLKFEEHSKHVPFKIDSIKHVHSNGESLPFDSTFYKLIKEKIIFTSTGDQRIDANIRNSKQVFNFSSNFIVQRQPTCLEGVKIRDGNLNRAIVEPLKLARELILSGDVTLSCVEDSNIKFKWKSFKVDSSSQLPRPENEMKLKGNIYNNEIVIRSNDLLPGLYVIMLEVSTNDVTDKDVTSEARDFSLIEVPTRKLEVLIKGGNKRQLGNETAVKFEASITTEVDFAIRFHHNWYCAVTLDDLPRDVEVGKVKRKGSCFNQQPLWIGDDTFVQVSNFKPNSFYFIRLIVTGEGYSPTYADQEIFILPQAPSLTLKCWTNCGKFISPNVPLILQSECSDCVRHTWFLNSNIMDSCNNQFICKFTPQLLQTLMILNNITVLGFDLYGRESSASLIFNVTSPPSDGHCSALPQLGKSYVTKFTVTCQNFVDVHPPLMYKFYMKHSDKELSLLQYGYDASVHNITMSRTFGVAFTVDICNSLGACRRDDVAVDIIPTSRNPPISDAIKEIDESMKANNIQRLLQLVAPLSGTTALSSNKRNKILKHVTATKVTSVKSAKQIVDVMNYVTSEPDLTGVENKESSWEKLSDVQNFMESRLNDATKTDLNSIMTSCVSVASNLMQASYSSINRIEETNKIKNFGRLLMTQIIPGESPMTYKTPGTEITLMRMKGNATENDQSLPFQIPGVTSIFGNDVINMEVYNYDARKINFNTSTRSVDFVTAVSLTTGWEKQNPISSERARNLPTRFIVPKQSTSTDLQLIIASDCGVTKCNSRATTSTAFEIGIDNKENLSKSFLRILLENSTHKVKEWKITLQLSDSINRQFNLTKKFTNKKSGFDWLIPFTNLPHGGSKYNLTIHAYLGSKYFRQGSVMKTSLMTHSVNCMYWDDVIFDWNNEGCQPSINSKQSELMCECDRFPVPPESSGRMKENNGRDVPTLFASSLIVYPNKIDYSKLSWNLWAEFLKNPVIFVCLFILYTSYGILVVLARKKDIEYEDKQQYIDVVDNSPMDKYRYYVTIYTGNRRIAGTSAVVCIKLIGSKKSSKVHILQNSEESFLTRGSINSYLITSFSCLGNLVAVRLWHDNSGRSPEWFLQRMVVRDLETNECTFFICNTWFDDVIDHIFPAARTRELHTFESLFHIKCENYLKDEHLWYSILAMRPWQQSEMSRVERLSACYLLIFMIMLTSLMFYGREVSQPGFQIHLGYYSFKWSQIAVGIESGLLCFPMTYIITTLFRFSRPRLKNRRDDLVSLERGELKHSDGSHDHYETEIPDSDDVTNSSLSEKIKNKSTHQTSSVGGFNKKRGSSLGLGDFHKSKRSKNVLTKNVLKVLKNKLTDIKTEKELKDDVKSTNEQINTSEVIIPDDNSSSFKTCRSGFEGKTKRDPDHRHQRKHLDHQQLYAGRSKERDLNSPTSLKSVKFSLESNIEPLDYSRHNYNTSWQPGKFGPIHDLTEIDKLINREHQNPNIDQPVHNLSKPKRHRTRLKEIAKSSKHNALRSSELNNTELVDPIRNIPHGTHHSNQPIRSTNSKHPQIMDDVIETKTKKFQKSKKSKLPPEKQNLKERSKRQQPTTRKNKVHENISSPIPSAGLNQRELYSIDPKVVGSNPRSFTMVDVDPFSVDFRPLPSFFVWIAWFFIFSTILGSSSLCVMYGMTYGVEISKEWLMSLLSGFIQSIILIEPFKAIFLASFQVINNPKHDLKDWLAPVADNVQPRDAPDPQMLEDLLKKERSKNPVYKPPTLDRMLEGQEKRASERKIRRRLKNISVHLLYLTFLLIVSFGQREENSFHFGQALNRMFVNEAKNIKSSTDFYKWIDRSLVGTLLNDHVTHFTDGQLIFVSGPLLRQKRVVAGTTCAHSDAVKKAKLSGNTACSLGYDSSFEDQRNYGPGWSTENPYFSNSGHKNNAWRYKPKPWTWISDYIGEHGTYDNGGYYVTVTDRDVAQYLRLSNWIDKHTRAIIFESIFYNVPHRIYCVTIIVMEIPNFSGDVHVTSQLHFMRTHHVEYASDVIVYVALICILIMVFYHLVEISSSMREIGFRFLWNLWNLFHVFVLLLSTAAVGVYLTRVTYTDMALKAYVDKMPSFELFHEAAYFDYVTRCLLSSCVFLTMFYTVKIMQGHPTFELMYATMRQSSGDLKGHSVLMFFLFCGFCHVGLMWFGDIKDFSTLVRTMQSVCGFGLIFRYLVFDGSCSSSDLLIHHPLLGSLFLFVFVVLFTKIFVNFYAVILENSFRECKLLMRDDITGDHVLSFGRKQLRSMFAIKEQKLKELSNPQERKEYIDLLDKQTAQNKRHNKIQ